MINLRTEKNGHDFKVLVVTKTLMNERDGSSLSIRNWFMDCYPENIAQIYSGAISNDQPGFSAYRLSAADRRFGTLFLKFRSAAQREAALQEAGESRQRRDNGSWLSQLAVKLSRVVIASGFWELIFRSRISTGMHEFIREFKPNLVLAQGFDLAFTELPVMIHKDFGIPIMTILVDDWEPNLYKGSPRLLGIRLIVRKAFVRLLRQSAFRFCISPEMAREYSERYGMGFDVLMQVDHRPVRNVGRASKIQGDRLVVAYSGSLALERWKGLLDLAGAMDELRDEGIRGEIRVYASSVPPEASSLLGLSNVRVLPPPPDDQVLPRLAEANIVFLPESFNPRIAEYIKLSISTKAHLYMMSGAVPLVYGPVGIGTVEYARNERWGVVVSEEGREGLKRALRSIVQDKAMADRVVATGLSVFEANHSPATRTTAGMPRLRGLP